MSCPIKFSIFGESAILISWSNGINKSISADVYNFNLKIQKLIPDIVLETVSAYNSLTVFIHKGIDKKELIEKLKLLYRKNLKHEQKVPTKWVVPVCYDVAFACDLANLAQSKNLSTQALINLHTQAHYKIDFIGFLPGFPYLSGLNPLLHTPRLEKPRAKIAKGSIAIGGEQTGIYPSASPGGWHIIGRTPLLLFNPTKESPCLFSVFDEIEFKAISKDEFEQIKNEELHA